MSRLRRFLAALLGVLLLQLTLQESAWACVRMSDARITDARMTEARTTDARGARSAATHEHGTPSHPDGHEHALRASSSSAAGPGATVSVPAPSGAGDPPCCTPDAMHGGCGTASAATVASEIGIVATVPAHARVCWPRIADLPPSLRAAPDVPPPKA